MSSATPLPPLRRSGLPWIVVTGLAIVADQASKAWITARFELFETVTLLPVLQIMRAHNTGAAWSFLADAGGWQRWGLSGLAIVVSVVFLVWLRRIDGSKQRVLSIAITLIMGGALGNVIDRLRLGHVVDFVVVHWNAHYFPAFNVADACITLGAIALFYDAFFDGRAQNGRKDAT
jgi:signal peptidase II